jgi:hypothetical protein
MDTISMPGTKSTTYQLPIFHSKAYIWILQGLKRPAYQDWHQNECLTSERMGKVIQCPFDHPGGKRQKVGFLVCLSVPPLVTFNPLTATGKYKMYSHLPFWFEDFEYFHDSSIKSKVSLTYIMNKLYTRVKLNCLFHDTMKNMWL